MNNTFKKEKKNKLVLCAFLNRGFTSFMKHFYSNRSNFELTQVNTLFKNIKKN